MNNRLKEECDWKTQKLVKLVEKMSDVSRKQFRHLRSALHGNGDYTVCKPFDKYVLSTDNWMRKSPEEKNTLVWKFLCKSKTRDDSKFVQATNSIFRIPKTSRIAKKN